MKCLTCHSTHTGSFGSGAYCSRSCANTRCHSQDTKQKISKTLTKEPHLLVCEYCSKQFTRKRRGPRFCSLSCAQYVISPVAKMTSAERSIIQKRLYATGQQTIGGGRTKWYAYKDIKVQGSYELRMCKILDALVDTGVIKQWSYTQDRFKYVSVHGTIRTYLPDFKVVDVDNTERYVETKGYQVENDSHKWAAVRAAGYKLEVVYHSDLDRYEAMYGIERE